MVLHANEMNVYKYTLLHVNVIKCTGNTHATC